jgi:hypothetical protein
MAQPDNDLDYWKRREERMKAEGRDAQNKAIAAEKARVDKQTLERAAGAAEGKAAKAKENAMPWNVRKRKEAASEKQRVNFLLEAANKDKKTAKKEALKKMLEKFKGGKGGRLGGIPGGGGVMPYDVR